LAADPSPFSKVPGGVRVRLRLTPKASANRVTGVQFDAEGGALLKAQVTAVPEGGKANAALIKMLAKEWKLAKSGITVIKGTTDRNKTLLVAGDPDELMSQLNNWASS
jgi:uncharacterized protein